MRKLIEIAILDIRIFFTGWSNIISVTVLPVILTLLLGGIGGDGGPAQIRFDLIDQDNSPASEQLITQLQDMNPNLLVCPLEQDEENACKYADDAEPINMERAITRVDEGATRALFVIPEGYGEALNSLETITLPYYTRSDQQLTGDSVATTIQAALQEINGAVIAARVSEAYIATLEESMGSSIFSSEEQTQDFTNTVYSEAQARWRTPTVEVIYETTEEGVQTSDVPTGFTQSVPGSATMFVLFTALGGIVLLLEERRQQTLARLVTMPVARWQVIGGKILSRFLLCMLQFGVVFAVGLAVGLDFGDDLVALVVVMMAFALCATALALALATVVRTEGQASSLTTLLALVLASIGGAWWSLDLPFIPQFMKTVSLMSPVRYAMEGFNQLLFYGGTLVDVLLPTAILLMIAAVLFFFGVRNFKYE